MIIIIFTYQWWCFRANLIPQYLQATGSPAFRVFSWMYTWGCPGPISTPPFITAFLQRIALLLGHCRRLEFCLLSILRCWDEFQLISDSLKEYLMWRIRNSPYIIFKGGSLLLKCGRGLIDEWIFLRKGWECKSCKSSIDISGYGDHIEYNSRQALS